MQGVRIAEMKVKVMKSAPACFNGLINDKTRSRLLFSLQCTCNIPNSLTFKKS